MKNNPLTLWRRFSCRRLFSFILFIAIAFPGIAQKVKVVNVEGPKKMDCGGFLWKVKFELDAKAPAKGFIVQKININNNIKNCDHTPFTRFTPDITYWEAWSVDSGSTTCKPAGAGGYNDQYSSPSLPKTYGTIKFTGKVAFFAMPALPASFKPGNPPQAGILLSDTLQPAFWTAAAEAAATDHSLTASWNCCDGKTDTTTLTTAPVLTVITVASINNPCTTTVATANLITSIPAWTKGYDPQKQASFNNIMNSLRRYSDTELMNGIQCIVNNNRLNGEDYLDNMSKVYIALRALYQVPNQLPGSTARVFGGWWRDANETPATYSPLWPLQRLPNGSLAVTGLYNGYTGFDYDALGEFNDFRSHYPRATVISDTDSDWNTDVNQTVTKKNK